MLPVDGESLTSCFGRLQLVYIFEGEREAAWISTCPTPRTFAACCHKVSKCGALLSSQELRGSILSSTVFHPPHVYLLSFLVNNVEDWILAWYSD